MFGLCPDMIGNSLVLSWSTLVTQWPWSLLFSTLSLPVKTLAVLYGFPLRTSPSMESSKSIPILNGTPPTQTPSLGTFSHKDTKVWWPWDRLGLKTDSLCQVPLRGRVSWGWSHVSPVTVIGSPEMPPEGPADYVAGTTVNWGAAPMRTPRVERPDSELKKGLIWTLLWSGCQYVTKTITLAPPVRSTAQSNHIQDSWWLPGAHSAGQAEAPGFTGGESGLLQVQETHQEGEAFTEDMVAVTGAR
jgi:hypothetical protein